MTTPASLPLSTIKPWVFITLALLAAIIGLASSAVTAEFFIAGLQNTDADTTTQTALVAAGLLMIAAELVAFFIAAVLPQNHTLRWPLWIAGVLLLIFETVTVFATQHALAQASTAAQSANIIRIEHLRASIIQTQSSATHLSQTAQEQVASRFIQQRETGADNLRNAQQLQTQASAQVLELSRLLANQRTTLADTFGPTGMVVYNAARALLLTVTGLIMMSAAGTLLRASMTVPVPEIISVPETISAPVPEVMPVPNVPVPPTLAQTVPITVPTVPNTAPTVPNAPTVIAATVPVLIAASPQNQKNNATVPVLGFRYDAAKIAVLDGVLNNPSVRAIQALVGGSTSTARAIQACLTAEGLIERSGQGYRLAEAGQVVLW